AYETGVANTADPVGGSENIEGLTDEIERGVGKILFEIEELGGTLRAIETGWIQQQIQNSAYEYQQAVESGKQIVVGVNRFQREKEQVVPTFRIDRALERAQVEELRRLRASRSAQAVADRLTELERAARDGSNLMPPILSAVAAHATVGEISDRL